MTRRQAGTTERCDVCNIDFTERRSLLRHQRSSAHTGRIGISSYRLACSFAGCAHTFAREDNRRRHEDETHRRIKRRKISARRQSTRTSEDTASQLPEIKSRAATLDDEDRDVPPTPLPRIPMRRNSRGRLPHIAESPTSSTEAPTGDSNTAPAIPPAWYAKLRAAGLPRTPSPRRSTSPRAKTKRSTDGVMFKCPQCKQHFSNQEELFLTHVAEHALFEEYTCEPCGVGFRHVADLKHHLRSAQDGNCGFAFPHQGRCQGHHPAGDPDSQQFMLGTMLRAWEGAQLRLHRENIKAAVLAVARRRDDEPMSRTPCPISCEGEFEKPKAATPMSCPKLSWSFKENVLAGLLRQCGPGVVADATPRTTKIVELAPSCF